MLNQKTYSLLAALFFLQPLTADICYNDNLCGNTIALEIDCGWRQDQIHYKLIQDLGAENNNGTVNSTSKMRNLNSVQTGLGLLWNTPYNVYLRIRGDYGSLYNGNEITQTIVSGRTPFGFNPKLKSGDVYDLKVGIGYQFNFLCNTIKIAPVAGWAINHFNAKFHNGELSGTFPVPGLTDIIAAKQQTTMKCLGPWIGLDFAYAVNSCVRVYASAEWHWTHLSLSQSDLLTGTNPTGPLFVTQTGSIKQKTNGNGAVEVTLGGDYTIYNNFSIGVIGHYRYWSGQFRESTRTQEQITRNTSGSILQDQTQTFPTQKSTTTWQSVDVALTLIYTF